MSELTETLARLLWRSFHEGEQASEIPRGICYCEEYVSHGEYCGPGRCSCSDPRWRDVEASS